MGSGNAIVLIISRKSKEFWDQENLDGLPQRKYCIKNELGRGGVPHQRQDSAMWQSQCRDGGSLGALVGEFVLGIS